MDQGRQAGSEADALLVPPVPVLGGTNIAERHCVRSRKLMLTTGAAANHREQVADKFAAAVGQDWWTIGETCALLLIAAGGRALDPPGVHGNPAAHRELADTRGIAGTVAEENSIHKR
jgi:hypothetical protein